jgi:hypothetical protein
MRNELLRGWMVLVVLTMSCVHASSIITPEDFALAHLKVAAETYLSVRKVAPTNWEQINVCFNMPAESKSVQRRLDQTYAFVKRNVPLDPYSGFKVLLVRVIPVQSYARGKLGRYVIGVSDNGFSSGFVEESKIQEMFQKAGVTLPKAPTGLPEIDKESGE